MFTDWTRSTCRPVGQEVEKEGVCDGIQVRGLTLLKNDRASRCQLPCFLADVQTAGLLVGGHCLWTPFSIAAVAFLRSGLWPELTGDDSAQLYWNKMLNCPACSLIWHRKQSPSSYVQKNFVIFLKLYFLVTLHTKIRAHLVFQILKSTWRSLNLQIIRKK